VKIPLKKLIIFGLIGTYIISPDLFPGPVDDAIVALIGYYISNKV
jgi:hypothetical protein